MTGQSFSGTIPEMIRFSETLIQIAGDLETLTDISASYYDKFFTDEEKHLRLQEQLTTILGSLNIALPETRQAYRDIVESLDLTTESGQTAYITLLKLAESADTYYSTLEDMADDLVSAAELAAQAIKEVLDATNTAISEQISLAGAAASAARSAANEYRNIIKSLTQAQESIRGGSTAEMQQRFESLFATAMTGDRKALSALPGAADKLLAGSLASSRTALDYARDQGKMLLALEEAKAVSVEGANWQDYQATLLETQVNVLKEIRDELQKESPDLALLAAHNTLLADIGVLLANGNDLTTEQTAQVLTGNATQDVIKNLQDLNTAYSIDMLSALVSQETTQATTLEGILLAGDNTVSLLSQLVAMMLSQQANQAAAEAAADQYIQAKNLGFPGYASGGDFPGGLRLVGEQGPELEYTGPSHIVNASKTEAFMSSNADLLAEIKKLNAKIDRLEAISYQTTKNTQKTAKTLEKFDYDGLPDTRVA